MTKTLLAALLITAAALTSAAELRGTVVGVSDGDTIAVLDGSHKQHKIRLAGIDAPEKHQGFAQRSREHLSNLAFKKAATLDCYKTDQYRRKVCRVWVDGVDVALAQVRAGLAWHYKQFQSEQKPTERTSYAKAEDDARASRRGLWQSEKPVPPWEFRQKGSL